MEELIKIKQLRGNQVVSARSLHEFLEIDTKFYDWCKRMFAYGFEDYVDYSKVSIDNEPIDYALSMDCAKEISMIQRTDIKTLETMNTKTNLLELTFTESNVPDQKPIARYGSKLCLVPGLKVCLPGETWACEIISDKQSYFLVNPVSRLKTISDNIQEFNCKIEALKDKFNHKIIA